MANIMALLRSARMGTTIITRMHVRRTAFTGLTGSQAAYSSALDPGSMGFMDAAGIGAEEGGVAAAGVAVASDADLASVAEADLVTAVGSRVAAVSEAVMDSAATLGADFTEAAGSMVMAADSTGTLEADFTAAGAFTAVVAGSTVVVEAMEGDTGN